MQNKLIVSILCPYRKVIARKYGTIQMPFFGINSATYMKQICEILPKNIYREVQNGNKYLIILGNIEGVMDIFERKNDLSNPLAKWLHYNNVFQTYNFLIEGLRKYKIINENFYINKINEINENIFFISAQDYYFCNKLQSYIPLELKKYNNLREITNYYKNNINPDDCLNLCKSLVELTKKNINLSNEELIEQNNKIRYGHRRAVGIFIEMFANFLGIKEYEIHSLFPFETMDNFHKNYNNTIINTSKSLSVEKDNFNLTKELIIKSLSLIKLPFPTITQVISNTMLKETKSLNINNFYEFKHLVNNLKSESR